MLDASYAPRHESKEPLDDSFVLIGAGLPRTGTMSMKFALEKLLGGRCCHMIDVHQGPKEVWQFWTRAFTGGVADQEWRDFMRDGGYISEVDLPAIVFYK